MQISKIKYLALSLMVMGIVLFIINALDIFLGYYITHGKGFQILGLILIVIGIVIWKIQLK